MSARPIRVTIVTGAYPPDRCGVGDYTARLASELARIGLDVTVITSVRQSAVGKPWRQAEATGATNAGNATGALYLAPVAPSWGLLGLSRLLRDIVRTQPDLVHVQYPTVGYGRGVAPNLLPWLLKVARPRLPVATTIHEFTTFGRLGRARIVVGALGSAAVVAPDPANLAALARAAPPLRGRLRAIPVAAAIEPNSPVDPDRRAAWRRERGIADAECLIVYFGFVSRSKGLDTLLRAAALAHERVTALGAPKFHVHLLAAPEANDPREAPTVEAVLATWRAVGGDAVARWVGTLQANEVSEYLHAADFAVLPFTDGASPRRTTLLAAIAHGLPVISTLPPDGAEPFAPDSLLLVPPNEVEPLAQAMQDLVTSPARRDQLGATSRRLAVDYNWPGLGQRMTDLYCDCLRLPVRAGRSPKR